MKITSFRFVWVFTFWTASITNCGTVDISDVSCGDDAPWVTRVDATHQAGCEATCQTTCNGYLGYLKNGRLSDPICFDLRLQAAGDFQAFTLGSKITFNQCRCYAPFKGRIKNVPENSNLLCTPTELFTGSEEIHDEFSCESQCSATSVLGLTSREDNDVVRLLHCGDVPMEEVKQLIPHCSTVKEKVKPDDGPEREIDVFKCTCSVPVALILFTDEVGSLRPNIQDIPLSSELPQPGSLKALKKDKGKEQRPLNHHRDSTTRSSHSDIKSAEKHRQSIPKNSSSNHTIDDIKPIIQKITSPEQKQSKRANKIPGDVVIVKDDDEPIGSSRRDKKHKTYQSKPPASKFIPPLPHEVLNIDSDDSSSSPGKKQKSHTSSSTKIATPLPKVVKEEKIETPTSLPSTSPRDKSVARNREGHSSSPSANNSPRSKVSSPTKHSPETSGLTFSGPATSSTMPDLSKLRRLHKKNAASSKY